MNLINDTSLTLSCTINNSENYIIEPNGKIAIDLYSTVCLLRVCHLYESRRTELFRWKDVYQIVINSELQLDGITESSSLLISGEIVHFELNYAYDRFFFMPQNCHIVREGIIVTNLQHLQELAYDGRTRNSTSDRIWDFLLLGNLGRSVGLFILFKLIFWANDWKMSWLWLPIICGIGYALQILGEKIVYQYTSKKQSGIAKINMYASISYIVSYYANPKRRWIGNDIMEL